LEKNEARGVISNNVTIAYDRFGLYQLPPGVLTGGNPSGHSEDLMQERREENEGEKEMDHGHWVRLFIFPYFGRYGSGSKKGHSRLAY
jgi:hypothetical protein